MDGKPVDEAAYAARVRQAVEDSVKQQIDAGLDVVSDGEMGKPSFITYAVAAPRAAWSGASGDEAEPVLQHARNRDFPEYYQSAGRRTGQPAAAAR